MSAESLIELHRRGDHAGVLRLARSIDVQPTADPQSALVVAGSLFQLGRYRDALQICMVIQPVVQNELSFLNLFALCLRRLDQVAKAEQVFRLGLEQHPASPALTSNYANLLLDQERLDEAETLLQQALAAAPAAAELRGPLARVQQLRVQRSLPSSITFPQDLESPHRALQLPLSPEEAPVPDASVVVATPHRVPPKLVPSLDPLLLAFSDEEVRLDQHNRRHLRQAKALGGKSAFKGSVEPVAAPALPELPEPPTADVVEELHLAAREALLEKQPEAALALADLLRTLDTSMQVEVYRVCAEAYLAISNTAAAEVCLHAIAEHGQLRDEDHLNLAFLSLRRHDLGCAEQHLNRVVDRHLHLEHLEVIKRKIQDRRGEVPPRLLFTVKGIKPVKAKQQPASEPVRAEEVPSPKPVSRSQRS